MVLTVTCFACGRVLTEEEVPEQNRYKMRLPEHEQGWWFCSLDCAETLGNVTYIRRGMTMEQWIYWYWSRTRKNPFPQPYAWEFLRRRAEIYHEERRDFPI